MTPQECGINVAVEIDADGTPIVNITTQRQVCLNLNNYPVFDNRAPKVPKQTYWAPDGSKVDHTIDLRGEE